MGKKLGLVHCRICKKSIDRNVEKEGIDWIMPSRNFFYHKSCYDSWKHDNSNIKAVKQDEEWIPYIWDFLSREIKVKYDIKNHRFCYYLPQWMCNKNSDKHTMRLSLFEVKLKDESR